MALNLSRRKKLSLNWRKSPLQRSLVAEYARASRSVR